MSKVAINNCYGGFGLSFKAMDMLYRLKHPEANHGLYAYIAEMGSDYKSYIYKRIDNFENDLQKRSMIECATIKDFGAEIEREMYAEDEFSEYTIYDSELYSSRHDPDLIKVIEELGSEEASDRFAEIRIVDIGDNKMYRIHEYDGLESVEVYPGDGWISIN